MSYLIFVLSFGQIPSRLAEQPISVLDGGYVEVAEFLNEYCDLHASLEELSISQELVEWLKTDMKGKLKEVSTKYHCYCNDLRTFSQNSKQSVHATWECIVILLSSFNRLAHSCC